MRLLNTHDLTFKEFFDDEHPSYYILSHTWSHQETTFDYVNNNYARLSDAFKSSNSHANPAIEKIFSFCDLAYNDGCEWVWIDTCCINKESSAELSEAINSMYKWYQNSQRCVVFLADVDNSRSRDQFAKSRWFTRGWTLQELLAPRNCVFVDKNWTKIGSKRKLASDIAAITGVKESILSADDPHEAILSEPIGRRMLWAADRVTTREEDIAYCLLGIFDINMTLLYGEGSKAFHRLQRKLIKFYDDETLLAWATDVKGRGRKCCGLLADHPSAFRGTDFVNQPPRSALESARPPVSLSNRGVEFRVFNRCLDEVEDGEEILLPLNCVDQKEQVIGIVVFRSQGRWLRSTRRHSLLPMGVRFAGPTLYDPKTVTWTVLYVEAASPRGQLRYQASSSRLSSQNIIRFSSQVIEPLPLVASLEPGQIRQINETRVKLSPDVAKVFDLAEIMYWTCRRKKITPEQYAHDRGTGSEVRATAAMLCRRMAAVDWEISDHSDSVSLSASRLEWNAPRRMNMFSHNPERQSISTTSRMHSRTDQGPHSRSIVLDLSEDSSSESSHGHSPPGSFPRARDVTMVDDEYRPRRRQFAA